MPPPACSLCTTVDCGLQRILPECDVGSGVVVGTGRFLLGLKDDGSASEQARVGARVCGACPCLWSLPMCELQPVDGDCVMAALDIEDEVLVALLDNAERTRVRLG